MLESRGTRGRLARPIARGCAPSSSGLAIALSILMALSAALVACGQASIPTPTCGTVAIDHLGQVHGSQTDQAETCFFQGFQQCRTVSLRLTHMTGVDTATESIFSVQVANDGRCQIDEADYDLVNTSTTATGTATCTGLSRQSG